MARSTGFSPGHRTTTHRSGRHPGRSTRKRVLRPSFRTESSTADNQHPLRWPLRPRPISVELPERLQVVPRLPHCANRDLGERHPDLEVRAHIHLNPSFPRVPFRREQRDRNLPAAAMLPPGVQTFPRASQGIGPALTIEAIQRDRRRGEIRLLDPASGGILPRVARPEHGDLIGSCDLPAIPGQEKRTGDLSLDESRDRPVVVLHALEVDAQPDRAVTGVVTRRSIGHPRCRPTRPGCHRIGCRIPSRGIRTHL